MRLERNMKIEERKLRLLGTAKFESDDDRIRWAVLAYGIFMATNAARRSGSNQLAAQAVMQHCRQGCEGHRRSTLAMHISWHSEEMHRHRE